MLEIRGEARGLFMHLACASGRSKQRFLGLSGSLQSRPMESLSKPFDRRSRVETREIIQIQIGSPT